MKRIEFADVNLVRFGAKVSLSASMDSAPETCIHESGWRPNGPHCNTGIHKGMAVSQVATHGPVLSDKNQIVKPQQIWQALHQVCPECHKSIIYLMSHVVGVGTEEFMAYPRTSVRPVPKEVPDPYRQDFVEACAVLPFSLKASATLSRRDLQAILRDKAGTKTNDLYDQIEEVAAAGRVPSHHTIKPRPSPRNADRYQDKPPHKIEVSTC